MPLFKFSSLQRSVTASITARRQANGMAPPERRRVRANSDTGGSGGMRQDRYNPTWDPLDEGSIVEGMIPRDQVGLNKLFKQIYARDPICGPIIDIISAIPWSEFEITNIDDPTVRNFYREAAQLYGDKAQAMRNFNVNYLMLGRFCATKSYDENRGYWTTFIPHDADFLKITPSPFHNVPPIIDITLHENVRKFINSKDPRVLAILEAQNPYLVAAYRRGGQIPLDPVSTLWCARQTGDSDVVGTSLLTRVLPIYALEQALINATVTAARRRAGDLLHVKAGIDNVWDPNEDELGDIAGLFQHADEDPVGAVVATRQGVDAQVVRSGGQVWKLSDEYQFMNDTKTRALGVSDAIFNLDACMVGETLVPTNRGLLRIGDICNQENGAEQRVELSVAGRYGTVPASVWFHNGKKPTLTIDTDWGYENTVSHNHPFLVFENGEFSYKRADALQVYDHICVSLAPTVRHEPLSFVLPDPDLSEHHSDAALRKTLTRPTEMTTDLAYVMGLLIAEGSVLKKARQVRCPNTDLKLIAAFVDGIHSIFGVESHVYSKKPTTSFYGVPLRKTPKQPYEAVACSKTLVEWLEFLGIPATENGGVSLTKHIPWSILQADSESQLAFLAGFIEGDGSTAGDRDISLHSASNRLLRELQTLLASLGFFCNRRDGKCLELRGHDSRKLWTVISPYIKSKTFTPDPGIDRRGRNSYGVPTDYWRRLLADRGVVSTRRGSRGQHVVRYRTDDGSEIRLRGFRRNIADQHKLFTYDGLAAGLYDDFLADLQKISAEGHAKLIRAFQSGLQLVRVKSIVDGGVRDVYDLSVAPGHEPAFVGNGVVVHNTYANMQQAQTFFFEQIHLMRDAIVYQTYDRDFEMLARAHGIVKRTEAELKHNVRIKKEADKTTLKRFQDLGFENMHELEALAIPRTDLVLPRMKWAKNLVADTNKEILNFYNELEQMGLPVTLRMKAGSAGSLYNLQDALNELPEDLRYRRVVKKFADAVAQLGGNPDDVGNMDAGGFGGDFEPPSVPDFGSDSGPSGPEPSFTEPAPGAEPSVDAPSDSGPSAPAAPSTLVAPPPQE